MRTTPARAARPTRPAAPQRATRPQRKTPDRAPGRIVSYAGGHGGGGSSGGAALLALAAARRDCPEIILPSLAVSVNVGHSLTPWAWAPASPQQVVAATPADYVLGATVIGPQASLSLAADATNNVAKLGQFRLMLGATGAEAEIARAAYGCGGLVGLVGGVAPPATATVQIFTPQWFPLVPELIAAGQRISAQNAARGSSSGADAALGVATSCYLQVYDAATLALVTGYAIDDLLLLRGLTASASVCFPDAGEATATGGAGAWALGAYVDLVVALPADHLVTGLLTRQTDLTLAPRDAQFEIATGAPGAEVVRGRVARPRNTSGLGAAAWCGLPFPVLAYAGERIRVRCAAAAGSYGQESILTAVELAP